MLRNLTTDTSFRALAIKPFGAGDASCLLGRRTVIYGRNGSGKTTFSELLRLASSGGNTEGVAATTSIRQGNANANVRLGAREFPWSVLVYNRYYVRESLDLFLDGSGRSPTILKLGATNVAAARELESVRSGLAVLERRRQSLKAVNASLLAERDSLEREVKSEVIAALSESDRAHYNTTSFKVNLAKALLEDAGAVELTPDEFTRETTIARSPTIQPVAEISPWPRLSEGLRNTINDELLGVEVNAQPIDRLMASPSLASWVELGRTLHEAGDVCGFCQQGVVSADLLAGYAQHFSEALNALRERLTKAREYLTQLLTAADEWQANLPATEDLLFEHRTAIKAQIEAVALSGVDWRNRIVLAISRIEMRIADPLTRVAPEFQLSEEFTGVDTAEIRRLVDDSRAACEQQAGRKKQAQNAVEKHFGATGAEAYKKVKGRIAMATRAEQTIDRRQSMLRARAEVLEQSQEDTGRMAVAIDADVRGHFGHQHLSVSVSGDGKGYAVRRGTKPATSLSEGERNAIAFSYFLRSLEAEGIEPSQTVVVIDDPVTSMDKESLFAGFALAEERTKAFAQVITLTHDYEYFRLQMGQRRNARIKSAKKIADNDANEKAFPAVSILEISTTNDISTGERISSLRNLPASLLRHPSEYHYLFLKVAEAVRDGDHEMLPVLGNVARRLIEGFISFRAPNGQDFQSKVDSIQRSCQVDEVLAKRVVKFLHGQSHREELRPNSGLELPSVETELKAALRFMQLADGAHFSEMCKAVGITEADVAASVQP